MRSIAGLDQKEKRKESHIALAVSRLHSRVLLSMESATETIGSRALLRCESWRTRRSLVGSAVPTVRNRGMCQCFDACAGPGARTLRFDGFQQLSGRHFGLEPRQVKPRVPLPQLGAYANANARIEIEQR